MTLELTREEHLRFCHHLARSHNIGVNNRTRISPERESIILQAIRDQRSNEYIKKTFRTSDPTITKIKKRHGLWGV
jgi:hypothetical protein